MTPPLKEPPIFVVGAGRSGTTLLQSLLSAHSRIAMTPETHFCAIWEQRVRDGPEAAWEHYLASRRFADLGVSAACCREIAAASPMLGPGPALAALLAAYGEAQGKPRVGEKTPGHWRHVRALLEWFPEARVIALRRDPRAFVASKLKAPYARRYMGSHGTALRRWTRLHIVAEDARLWARIYGEALPALLADARATLVPYEALVGDPEGTLRSLCAFLGEAFEPAMLDDRAGQAGADGGAVGGADGAEWRGWRERHLAASRRPVSAGSLEKWRAELTAREVAAIEAVAGPVMERCGYALDSTAAARRAARRRAALTTAAGGAELAGRRALAAARRGAGGRVRMLRRRRGG